MATEEAAIGHTPGPWEMIAPPEDHPMHGMIFVRAPQAIIENDRGPSYATTILSDEYYPTKMADGLLVAAAPDLLKACKLAVAAMGNMDAARHIQAVIDKAEGRF